MEAPPSLPSSPGAPHCVRPTPLLEPPLPPRPRRLPRPRPGAAQLAFVCPDRIASHRIASPATPSPEASARSEPQSTPRAPGGCVRDSNPWPPACSAGWRRRRRRRPEAGPAVGVIRFGAPFSRSDFWGPPWASNRFGSGWPHRGVSRGVGVPGGASLHDGFLGDPGTTRSSAGPAAGSSGSRRSGLTRVQFLGSGGIQASWVWMGGGTEQVGIAFFLGFASFFS